MGNELVEVKEIKGVNWFCSGCKRLKSGWFCTGIMGILASAWHLYVCHPCEPQTLFFIAVLVVMSLILIND